MIAIPYLTALTTCFSYGLLFAYGQFRDFFRKILDWFHSSNLQGDAPICLGLEDFYIRRLYLRIQKLDAVLIFYITVPLPDCFGRPISSAPYAWFDVVVRYSNDNNKTLKRTTKISRCLNLGSYNYLGFAAADEYCTPHVIESLKRFSPTTCSSHVDGGTTTLHTELEECVANFVGKPAAIVFGMGYVTNSAILPVLIGKREYTVWKGSSASFQKLLQYARNEAHSIGAVGKTGRGVCELLGVDPADVGIMMGTFTKSFGSCGGYIAGSKELVQYLKYTCCAHLYATSISPPVAQQIISAVRVILGEDGTSKGAQKLALIRENSNFFLVAVVTVAFPATPLLLAWARICISASHTKEDLLKALEVISRVGDLVGIKYFPAEPAKQQQEKDTIKLE
ncbi:hypothetical protein L1049_028223 [Liquidambar formosana]|uniref:serine C-palmitoyltransferase n=1 Tax=Liquidambar formosana TaxID=63359 RepID=A0AAP0WWP0_LIQFO